MFLNAVSTPLPRLHGAGTWPTVTPGLRSGGRGEFSRQTVFLPCTRDLVCIENQTAVWHTLVHGEYAHHDTSSIKKTEPTPGPMKTKQLSPSCAKSDQCLVLLSVFSNTFSSSHVPLLSSTVKMLSANRSWCIPLSACPQSATKIDK